MTDRVALFIDYHNVYKGARDAFFPAGGPHWSGQVHPQRLGLKLAGVGNKDRELAAVRVYRGQPSTAKDQKGSRAFSRQTDAWSKQALTTVVSRPLNYRTDPPREKGIDVRIAIDYVMMAMRNEFDVGIIFSGDTDLLPPLEAVAELKGAGACEVAAWLPSDGRAAQRLRISGAQIWCHLLKEEDYRHVQDKTDYTLKAYRR